MKFELDYGFARTELHGFELALLRVTDCSRGAGGTAVVDAKGPTKFAMHFVENVVLDSGHTTIRLVTVSEPSSKALPM